MSELLFRADPYLRACEATVLAVHPGREAGDQVGVELDRTVFYRHRLMRYHTALHLLGEAHLDFDIEMEKLVKDDIEARLNELVASKLETRVSWITDVELDARPDLVKTMSVAPPRGEGRVRLVEIPGVDLQACGGTHVRNSAEIGPLAVARTRSEGKRNKRVTLTFAESSS